VTVVLEFWPEYGGGPLWTEMGQSVDLSNLEVSTDLKTQLSTWNLEYDDSKLPFETNDVQWLEAGKELLARLRNELGGDYQVIVTEPWWGEVPVDYPQNAPPRSSVPPES
jgi:hypothetical protein